MMGFINEVPRKVYFNSNSTMFSLAENFLLMCPEFEEEIYKDDEDDYSMSPVFKISYYFNGKSVNDLSLKLCDLGIKAEENILLSPISADPNFDVFMKKITSMNKFCNARYGKISFDKRPKFTFKIKNNDFYAMRRREMQLKDVFNSFKTLEQKFIEDSKISEQLQKSINDMQIGTTNIKDLKNSKLSENSLPTLW